MEGREEAVESLGAGSRRWRTHQNSVCMKILSGKALIYELIKNIKPTYYHTQNCHGSLHVISIQTSSPTTWVALQFCSHGIGTMCLLQLLPVVKLSVFCFPCYLLLEKTRLLSCKALVTRTWRYKQMFAFWCSWSWAGPKDFLPHIPRDATAAEHNSKLATASRILGVKDPIPK